jgi:PAS domain S-box-containing protein
MAFNPDSFDRPARVLIVDDDPRNAQLLEIMLATEGFALLTAFSGEEVLSIVAQQPPDLVLLDVMMPGMGGYEVTRVLKGNQATRNIPIIMVTALDDREARMLGLKAGAEDFLSKPVDRAELCVRVRNLLRLKAYGDYHDKYGQMLEGEVGSRAAALAESEGLYRSTFDGAPVGIVHVGVDGQWLKVNQRFCDLLGYSREELQGTVGRKLTEPEEVTTELDAFRHMVAGAIDRHVVDERRYRRRDGSFVWVRVNMSVHRNAQGQFQHFISVMEDITERRVLEAQARQANKMDAIGRLASGVAHDFNNLLSIVLSYSDLVAADLKESDPLRADMAEIKRAGLRAADLTRQLLAFSRQQVLQPKVVDLTEIVGGMGKMLKRLIGEDVELTVSGAAVGKITVDPGQMEQVIMNLIVNARDAMPGGGAIAIETTDLVVDETYAADGVGLKPGPYVLLVVSDTGVGMDKATQARAFEPFFTTKEAGHGTGIGLATVFGIVQQMGGMIWLTSELAQGTTFKIYFPAAARAVPARNSIPYPELRTLRGSETILLVEDEEGVRALARKILGRYGYNVLEAQSGGDAFLLCEQHTATIDLLLTDLVMPRMNGRQLAERLLAIRPDLKVLYMSGHTDDAVIRLGVQDSTIAFIQKPITPEPLARKVREILGEAAAAE